MVWLHRRRPGQPDRCEAADGKSRELERQRGSCASALDVCIALRVSRTSDDVIVLCTMSLVLIELQSVARACVRRIEDVGWENDLAYGGFGNHFRSVRCRT